MTETGVYWNIPNFCATRALGTNWGDAIKILHSVLNTISSIKSGGICVCAVREHKGNCHQTKIRTFISVLFGWK